MWGEFIQIKKTNRKNISDINKQISLSSQQTKTINDTFPAIDYYEI